MPGSLWHAGQVVKVLNVNTVFDIAGTISGDGKVLAWEIDCAMITPHMHPFRITIILDYIIFDQFCRRRARLLYSKIRTKSDILFSVPFVFDDAATLDKH